jgi:hypothetical protein
MRVPTSSQYGNIAQRAAHRQALLERRNAHHHEIEGRRRENLIRRQDITIQIRLDGPQYVTARAFGAREPGAHLSVVIGTVVFTIKDPVTASRYVSAWTCRVSAALLLPRWVPRSAVLNQYAEPGVAVAATSADGISTKLTPRALTITIGRITWEIPDRDALNSVLSMWRAVESWIPHIWPV